MTHPQQIDLEDVAPAEKKPRAKKAELVKIEKSATPANPVATSDTAAILGMIERLSCQPDVQVERVDQLFALYQRMQADASRKAFDAAFAAMQPELPVIEKRGAIVHEKKDQTAKVQSRYAKWEDIVEGVAPVLAKHGFALSFKIDQPSPERVVITGTLSHRDGHRESTSFALPIDASGSKNNVQGWASSVSYGKRYTGCALLNIVSREGEDDDGTAAGAQALTFDQVGTLFDLVAETGANLTQFLVAAHVDPFEPDEDPDIDDVKNRIAQIKPSEFERLHNLLTAKKAKAARK